MCTPHPLSPGELFNLKGWVATLAANGAKVYITGHRKEVLEKSAGIHGSAERLGSSGDSIVPLVMDVRSKGSIKAVVDEISAKETHVNAMLNIVFMTNCVSIYYVTAALIPLLFKTAASPPIALRNVMNVLSKEALQKTTGNYPYAMAYELRKDSFDIRVNAIAPGIPTPSGMTGQGKVDDENMGFVSDEILQFVRDYCAVTTEKWNTPQGFGSYQVAPR
ncbi:NAD(P)-binding protein [Biscogniauxia mediterranea]|nr:NAD(P)-binding protein [Biscogniauxia mediterranea]